MEENGAPQPLISCCAVLFRNVASVLGYSGLFCLAAAVPITMVDPARSSGAGKP